MRERDGRRARGEWSRRSAKTTNTNRSLNCKHNLNETEAARFEPWPQVTAASATECVLPANDKNKMLIFRRHVVATQWGDRGAHK